MVKRPTTSKSHCYTTLWCIVSRNKYFRLFPAFFWH